MYSVVTDIAGVKYVKYKITSITDIPLRVKISRGAPLEVQNGTQQDLNKMIDLVNFGGKKIVCMLKMGGFDMGPNKIWIKW